MDPSEQSSLPYPTHNSNDTEEDYPAQQSQAVFYPGNLQSNRAEVSSIVPGSYSYPFYQYGPCDESEYLSIQQSAPATPNDQLQFYPQPQSPSNDISRTHDQVLDSFLEGHPIDNDTRRLASIQAHRAAGWGITAFQTMQEGTTSYLEAPRASGFDTPGSSSSTIGETPSSLSDDGFPSQYGVRDDHPHATSSFRGQVQGVVQNHVVTREQDAAQQEALRRREQKNREKREGDRRRKRADRAGDDQAYSRVCSLLAIRSEPKNTLSQRILKSVESIDQDFERMCELLEISMTPKETLAHRILESVEAMTERQKLDRDLRRQLEQRETELAVVRLKSVKRPTGIDTGSGLPTNIHTALGGPDTGVTFHSRP